MKLILLLLFLLCSSSATTQDRYGGIYLGDNVGSIDGDHDTAVEINSHGVVTVYIGAAIPGLHDIWGRQVYIKSVKVVKSK